MRLALLLAIVGLHRAHAFVFRSGPVCHPSLGLTKMSVENVGFPTFVPAEVLEIREPEALDMARQLQRRAVSVPSSVAPAGTIDTSYVSTTSVKGKAAAAAAPMLFLHGFDSSCLEFRRLLPALQALGAEAYAVDVLGWGFTQLEGVADFGAAAKRAHLYAFWKDVMGGRPMTIVGASLGGAIAIDFAHEFPEAVEKLVLIDGQAYIDGSGPGAALPGFAAKLGIRVLGSKPLRSLANNLAYKNKKKYATEDAMRIGRLHVLQPGWEAASLSYMQSGGFAVSTKVAAIAAPTLVLWGRQDEILDPKLYAMRYEAEMPNATLKWVEDCGHVPHLEQPAFTAAAIASFVTGKTVPQPPECANCSDSRLQPCPNCDGEGYYVTYDRRVTCNCCKGGGRVVCRQCFTGDPWDLEEVRVRAQALRNQQDVAGQQLVQRMLNSSSSASSSSSSSAGSSSSSGNSSSSDSSGSTDASSETP